MNPVVLAIDLGAESGRVIAAELADGAVRLSTLHRFTNAARQHRGHLRWDVEALWAGICTGLALGAERHGAAVRSIAVDTWGVDYVLLDAGGEPLAEPVCYRDLRTHGAPERARALIDDAQWWQRSGIRSMPFNTAYQLLVEDAGVLARAEHLLTMPDYLAWRLSGVMANEWTNASTTQLCAAGTGNWDHGLLTQLGLPTRLFAPTQRSGTVLGGLCAELVTTLGFAAPPQVVLAPAHDTAAAVAAMPCGDGAFLSCGTWSLMGVLCSQPVLSESARRAELSNELAHDGRTRLLKNIMGLWVLQQARRGFAAAGREYDYAELTELAAAADEPAAPLAVDDERFFTPGEDYLERIVGWYREQGLRVPNSDGAIARAILRGLAAAYGRCFDDLAAVTGCRPLQLVVLGGGVRNGLLRQFTEEACGCPVLAGSAEATALGNALVQLVAIGALDDAQLTQVAAASSLAELQLG